MTKPRLVVQVKEPLLLFHGSGTRIDKFDYRFTDIGNDQLGSGFYFTSDPAEAIRYCFASKDSQPKPGGEKSPTVHVARVTVSKLLASEADVALDVKQVATIIRGSPCLKDALTNWGEEDFEGREALIGRATESYIHVPGDGPLLHTLNMLANDFYPDNVEAFNRMARAVTGFDGVIHRFDKFIHLVAWFPEQIEIVDTIPVTEKALEQLNSIGSGHEVLKKLGRRP